MRLIKVMLLIIALSLCVSAAWAQENDWVEKAGMYYNETYDCGIMLPDEWAFKAPDVYMGPYNAFFVQMFSPDFISNIVFVAQKNITGVTAEEAIKMEIGQLTYNTKANFHLLNQGTIEVGDLSGYQMSDKVTEAGVEYTQKRVYFADKKFVYGLILNAP